MDFTDLLLKRRSVREFTDEDITKSQLNKILEAGLLAPTGRNLKPCNFLIISNKSTLNELANIKESGSQFLSNANKAIIVVADSLKSDTWIEDSSICLAYMQLMAASLDVGSCWVQIHLRKSCKGEDCEELVRNITKIDDFYRIVGILALGIPKNKVKPHTIDEIDKDKIHFLV